MCVCLFIEVKPDDEEGIEDWFECLNKKYVVLPPINNSQQFYDWSRQKDTISAEEHFVLYKLDVQIGKTKYCKNWCEVKMLWKK